MAGIGFHPWCPGSRSSCGHLWHTWLSAFHDSLQNGFFGPFGPIGFHLLAFTAAWARCQSFLVTRCPLTCVPIRAESISSSNPVGSLSLCGYPNCRCSAPGCFENAACSQRFVFDGIRPSHSFQSAHRCFLSSHRVGKPMAFNVVVLLYKGFIRRVVRRCSHVV